MEQVEAEWLALFTRGKVRPEALSGAGQDQVKLAKDDERVQMLRAAELEKSISVVDAAKKELAASLAMQFEVDGKTTTTRDAVGRQDKEFDTEDTAKVTSDQSNESAYKKAVNDANTKFRPLAQESARLRELTVRRHVYDGDGKDKKLVEMEVSLFEDSDIMRDFWTPLVREQIVPENFVPPKYSATQQMIDGSNDFFIEECREKGEEPELGLADFGKQVVAAASMAAQGAFPDFSDIDLIIEGTALAIGAGIDGITLAQDSAKNRTFDVSRWEDIGDSVAAAVGQIAGGLLDNDNQGDAYGQMVSAGVHAFGFSARMTVWAADPHRKEFPWDDLVGDILAGSATYLSVDADRSSDTGVSDNDGIAAAAINGFSATLKSGVTQLKGLSLDSPPSEWAKALTKVLVKAVAESTKAGIQAETNIVENSRSNAANDETTETNYAASAASSGIDSAEAAAEKAVDAAFGDKDAKNKKQAAAEQEIEDAQAQIEAEKKDYKDSLDRLGATDADIPSDAEFKSIAKLMAKMKNDRKILEMAAMVGSATAEVASHFFAPLKAAHALIKFMVNVHAAVERASALLDWLDANEDALTSASPYATSIQNFVKNQGDQLTHHTVQAAVQGLQAASAAAEIAYPPVKALTMALSAASLLEDAIFTLYQKQQLKSAWKTTKKALENPANRKLGLIARKMNPTLAKYTIAYGAVIEKSEVAITAMGRCGLDRETLSRAGGNVRQVKDFLQELYHEDGILLGPIPQGAGKTALPKPALSVKSWVLTVELWKQEHRLNGDPPAAVRLQLAELDKIEAVDEDSLEPDDKVKLLVDKVATSSALEVAFNRYEPKDAVGLPIKNASKVLSAYADLAGAMAELSQQAGDMLA